MDQSPGRAATELTREVEVIYASGIPVHCAHDEIVDVDALVPNPRNPNRHSPEQIRLLAKTIRHQGWRAPITVSNRSGFIVRGHGRLAAAKLLGVDLVPVDRQDYATEAEEWADLIADNRLSELSEMDNPTLKELLQQLDSGMLEVAGADMEISGYPGIGEDAARNAWLEHRTKAYDRARSIASSEGAAAVGRSACYTLQCRRSEIRRVACTRTS